MDANLTEQLKNLTNKDGGTKAAVAEPVAAPAAQPTGNFSSAPEKVAKPVDPQKQARDARANDIAKQLSARSVAAGSPRFALLSAISQHGRVGGYITKNGAKLDFRATKTSAKDAAVPTYKIGLHMAPPTAVEGTIVMIPAALLDLLNTGDGELDQQSVVTAAQDTTVMLNVIPKEELVNFMLTKTGTFLPEAEEIFEPFFTKNMQVRSYGDARAPKNSTVPPKPALYVSVNPRIDPSNFKESNVIRLKHTYRSRLQTPKNYISLKEYATVPMKRQYTPEEANEMINLYLSRFTVPAVNQSDPIISKLDRDSLANFEVKPGDATNPMETIASSTFFPTTGNSWLDKPDLAVKHWFYKNEDGTPKTLDSDEIQLVMKEKKEGAKSIRIVSRELKDTTASEGSYRFEPTGKHKAIVDACKGQLSFDSISGFRPTRATSSRSSAVTAINGASLMGLDKADIIKLIRDRA